VFWLIIVEDTFKYVRKINTVTDFIFTLRLCRMLLTQGRILVCNS